MSTTSVVTRLRFSLLLLAFVCAPSMGIAAESDEVAYRALVERVKGGDLTVDFRALRLACLKSRHCEPRGSIADLTVLNGNDPDAVAAMAEKLIQDGYVNIEAHAAAAGAYAKLNQPQNAQFHSAIALALLRSIKITGDGKTTETAFEVICDREEYLMLSARGLAYSGSNSSVTPLTGDGPHRYERWKVQDPKTGQDVVVFFNIDAFSDAKSYPRKQ